MNIAQRQSVINFIEQFKELNLEEIFVSKFGNEANPEETSVGDYFVTDVISLSKKMTSQLERKINESNSWQLLPATHNFNNDFGSCQMPTDIQNFVIYMSRGDYNNVIIILKRLIYYQIANGFWEQQQEFNKRTKIENISTIEERITLLSTHLDERRTQYEDLLNTVTNFKEQLDDFISNKNKEYDSLTEKLKEADQIYTDIAQTQKNAITQYSLIEKIKENIDKHKEKIENVLTETLKTQQERDEKFSIFETISQDFLNGSEKKLKEITRDHQYVNEKKEEVRKMMGYIADGTLSHSFNSRKTKIEKMKNIWLCVSIISAVLMGVWIYVVFTCLTSSTGKIVVDMLINVAKTTPLIALFWFSLKQYSKERNLAEEYAFREAVSVTLTAYANQVVRGEEESNERIDLIRETVEKLYTKPQITNEGIGLFSFKSKDIVDLLKEVKEIVGEFKNLKNN